LEGVLQTAVLLLGIALFVAAAYGDITTFRIPNALVAAIAVLGVLRLIDIGEPNVALYTVGTSLVVFIAAFLLFWQGLVGGGDAKLITAAALLVGYNSLFNFLLVMSVCGALVTLAVLVMQQRSSAKLARPNRLSDIAGLTVDQPLPGARLVVPYGAAVAGGAIVTLLFQPSLIG
jgi:prepilin peptidase CpaA